MGAVPDKFEDGTAAFFTNRELAWHTLGTVTDGALTAADALKIAYLDSPVTKVPAFAFVNGEYVEVEGKWVTGSHHPKKPIWRPHGIVGDGYEIVQNAEQFEILDTIRDDSGAIYETAGSMYDGKVVFVTMKMPDSLVFNGNTDRVDLYLMAMNSHDGTKAFTLAVTPVRVVCQNTLTMALAQAQRMFKIKHTRNAKARVTEAREALGLTFAYVDEFEQQIQRLINAPMTDKQFVAFADKFIGNKDTSKQAETRAANNKAALIDLWHAPTQQVAGKNKWGAWNAVTEYVDWTVGVRVKKADNAEQARALRILSPAADAAKQRGLQLLLK